MRTAIGIVLAILGLPLFAAGVVGAIYIGPDDTVEIVDAHFDTEAAVLATTPSVLGVAGPTLHVSADAGEADVFVGAAHPVHVDSYLADVAHETITEVGLGGEVTSATEDGPKPVPDAPPEGLGWWQGSSTGSGEQSISVELTEQPLRIVVMHAEPGAPLAVDVAAGAEVGGAFVVAVVVGVVGLASLVGAFWLIRSARRRRRRARLTAVPPPADAVVDEEPSADDEPSADEAGDGEETGRVIPLPGRHGAPPPPSPDSTPPGPPRPTARVRLIAGFGGMSALVTGCAQLPQPVAESERPTTVEAITPAAADDFFAHYTETNNAANATRDDELIATVEAGALLETTRFAYEEQEVRGAEPFVSFTIAASAVAAPRLGEYPLWSFVATEPDGDQAGSWYLLTRADAASPWLAHLAVHPEQDVAMPQPVSRDGSAVVADDEIAERGDAVLDELTAFAETGQEPDDVDLSYAGGVSRLPEHGLQLDDAPAEFGSHDRQCRLRDPDQVHWLTTEFGAMTLAAIECTQTMGANPGYSVVVGPEGLGIVPGGAEIVNSSITQSVSFMLAVDTDGSATVVGDRMRPTAMDYSEA